MTNSVSVREKILNREILTGVSMNPDPAEAVRELHAQLYQPDAACIVFYCCVDYDLISLAEALKQWFPDVPVVGCTTAGEVSPVGLSKHSITGFCLPDSTFVVEPMLIESMSSFATEAAAEKVDAALQRLAQRAIAAPLGSHSFALSLLDGMSIREELLLDALNSPLNDIPLVGGSAGDNLHFKDTHMYFEGEFHNSAAVMLLVNTHCPFQVISSHHLAMGDEKLVVTKADPSSRVAYEINAEPAALEYCRVMGLSLDDLTSRMFAMHPLGVQVGAKTYVRSVQKVNDDLSLSFFCAIDTGVVLTKMCDTGLMPHFKAVMKEVTDNVGEPQLVIGFDCIHRRIEAEDKGLLDELSNLYCRYKVVGFSTYGEQRDEMHVNHTFSGVVIGRGAND